MATHKWIDKICCVILVLTLLITVLFLHSGALGAQKTAQTKGYVNRLFDTSVVHTIDIVMDDWKGFLATCTDEEYVPCNVVIDGESRKNVGLRAKGNTSLTNVMAYGNDRYSFKIEFDHYDSTKSYFGLDKLSLNNIIQDNTYLKDYLCYQMMNAFGVAAPLCSFVQIRVNGEEWGLYLAVEGVEEAFLERNYGRSYGELYKPDSQNMGGGRGNGGKFNMDDWEPDEEQTGDRRQFGIMRGEPTLEQISQILDRLDESAAQSAAEALGYESAAAMQAALEEAETVEAFLNGKDLASLFRQFMSQHGDRGDSLPGGMGGGMGSNDVKLIYTDDDYSSYSNIFDSAKTNVTDKDKDRLIASLKKLGENLDIEDAVDVDAVIRYFVVHNFVCNFDSYTGSMIHNYYLYEQNGQLSMIPWDYNLAFGAFGGASDATNLVNFPIDSPVSGGTADSRPMLAWIFANEAYTDLYHQYFGEFIASYFDGGYFAQMIDSVQALIRPYVQSDPTKFCTYEEFETGIQTLKEFCLLRAESISGQLDGTIPATSEAQNADRSALVDASGIRISDMGSMGGGMGKPNGGGNMPTPPDGQMPDNMGGTGGFGGQQPGNFPGGNMGGPFGGNRPGSGTADATSSATPSDRPDDMSGDLPDMIMPGGDFPGMFMPGGDLPDQPDGMERPEGTPERPGTSGQSANAWLLLGLSGAVLLAGLGAAFLYRKKA